MPRTVPDVVVLRYFPIPGRVEALRHALADAGVPFTDTRVSDEQWARERGERGFGGSYRGLPTLTWGTATLEETLPIASFVARQLGQYDGVSDVEIARREAMVSNAYLEIIVRLGETIWADFLYPGVDLTKASSLFARTMAKAEALDRQLSSGLWIAGAEPTVPDFFAAEALHAIRYVLGPERHDAIERRLGALCDLSARVEERPRLAQLWKCRPAGLTARPDEDAVVARIRRINLASVGL